MNAIAERYLAENENQVNAIRQLAKDLMLGDETSFKAGYSLENAVIATAEAFDVSRRDVYDALGEDSPETTAKKYRALAHDAYTGHGGDFSDGDISIDEDAAVSESDEGAYVAAWVWVDRARLEAT